MSKKLEEAAKEVSEMLNEGYDVNAALQHIQLKLKAPKDQVNSFAHFNYRTAGAILERVKPLLEETGCHVRTTETLELIGTRYYIKSVALLHHIATNTALSATAYAREDESEKGKSGAQMTGSSSTYAKKYALAHLFAIDDSADDPDITSGQPQPQSGTAEKVQQAVNALNTAATKEEVDGIKAYFGGIMSHPAVLAAGAAAKQRIGY